MLLTDKYIGIVEDIDDPLKKCRCKIRIKWLHGDIETKYLPWANPITANTFGMDGRAGDTSVPKLNAVVNVEFRDGDMYKPEYAKVQELAKDVLEQLAQEYEGTHIMLFDGDVKLKMYFTKTRGLTFSLDDSRINIAPDNVITIEHKNTSSIIELSGGTITINSDSEINLTSGTRIKSSSQEVWEDGKMTKLGHQPQYSSVLGEPLFAILQIMAEMIDVKMYPTPGVASNAVSKLKTTALSETVKVSK